MASIKFELDHQSFLNFTDFLKHLGFQFVSGGIHKCEVEIFRSYSFLERSDYPYGGASFYLFPRFVECIIPDVRSRNNIHMGRIFALNPAYGGPYLMLRFTVSDPQSTFKGELELRPRFNLSDGSTFKPCEKMREAFVEIGKFLKHKKLTH